MATIELNQGDRKIPFTYPTGGNINVVLGDIFTGKEYPVVTLPNHTIDVIVDVGANIGATALYFHINFPQARLICFEPSPTSFAFLDKNLSGMGQIELHPFGLSDQSKRVKLFLGHEHCMQNSVMHSAETGSGYEEVEIRRASEEFERLGLTRVSLLKIDTEGCELPILRDLAPFLDRVDLLYLEYHSEEDRKALDALLTEQMMLLWAKVIMLHRGSMIYLSRRLLPLCQGDELKRITPL